MWERTPPPTLLCYAPTLMPSNCAPIGSEHRRLWPLLPLARKSRLAPYSCLATHSTFVTLALLTAALTVMVALGLLLSQSTATFGSVTALRLVALGAYEQASRCATWLDDSGLLPNPKESGSASG